jgi:hypothetical protein
VSDGPRRALVDRVVLVVWALTFNLLPLLTSDVPLSRRLSSDAEWYSVAFMRLASPPLIATDDVYALDLLPVTERAALAALGRVGTLTGADVLDWSVGLSFASVLVFVLGAYSLMRTTLRPGLALLVSAALVVPVHALGGTQLGFQATGFLPRDFGLALSMLVILLYVRAGRRTDRLAIGFLACGLLANVYSMLYAHLGLVLLGAEALRDRAVRPRLFAFAALLAVGAFPTVLEVITAPRFGPPDLEVLRLREGSLLLGPMPTTVTQLLRRPLLYALLLAVLVVTLRRSRPWLAEAALHPWFAIAASSAAVTAAGLVIENATPFVRYLPSRASVFFLLAAMVLSAALIPTLTERWWSRRGRAIGLGILILIFAGQSNLPTVARQLLDDAERGDSRRDLIAVANHLRVTTPATDSLLAPSEELADIAASLRTYARRPVFVSFKDLGVVLYDGARGRSLYRRWRTSQDLITKGDLQQIRSFLRDNGLAAAIVPSSVAGSEFVSEADHAGRFVIVRP